MVGDTSQTGAYPGGNTTFGSNALGTTATNDANDILKNSKLVIVWGCDPAWKNYNTTYQNTFFQQWKAAGIKIIVVDAFAHNDTAALYADQFISPLPGTDEALLAAIAYVWILNGTSNKSWVATHTIGFDSTTLPAGAPAKSSFSDYILGNSDGIPKTPARPQQFAVLMRQPSLISRTRGLHNLRSCMELTQKVRREEILLANTSECK